MSKRLFQAILTSIVGLMFVFGDAFYLCAQESTSEEFTLEEITVTAQKRAENQQKVAIPMEVLTGDQLTTTGRSNVDDILSGISNVMVNYAADGMRVSLRGLTENEPGMDDIHVSNPTVAINIDGAFNKNSNAGQNLFDVERVEVLVGPQSTLYASNSPGGIVNVITAAPKTDKYSASGTLEVGNYGLLKFNGMVNVPLLTDKLAMRLAANQERRDPYVSSANETGEDTKSARLKTLWQATDDFSATVIVNYTKRINSGMMGGQVQPFDYQDGYWYANNMTKIRKVADPWTSTDEFDTGGMGPMPGLPNGPNAAAAITKGVTGDINWDTGIGNLSIVPQYNKTTSDDNGWTEYTIGAGPTATTQDVYTHTHMNNIQKGVEARMTSAADFFFKWIAGFNYYNINNERLTTYDGFTDYKSFYNKERNIAAFANITYPLTDTFRGTAGYRRTWDKTDVTAYPPTFISHYGQNYQSPDYNVGFEYDLASNSMLYVNFKTSYRINPMAADQGERTIPPEKLKAYTVGAKNRFLGNTLQLNVAAFYYDYKNKEAQVNEEGRIGRDQTIYSDQIVDPDGNYIYGNTHTALGGPGSGAEDQWIKQHGTFRSIGVDISAEWVASSKDRVNLGISYLNAKWKELKMVFYWKTLDSNGNVIPFWPSDGDDYSGWTNTYSPTWTINGGYEHNFELGSFGTLVPRVDLQYKSDYVMDYMATNYPVHYQEPYYLVNGSMTFSNTSGIWSVNAYVKNATNYAAKNLLSSGMGWSMGITDPRTYGAVVSVKF
jgi:iron complex outermembrane recepter protein